MIPIRTYKQYWDAYLTRVPEIKHVFLVYNESDLSAKIRDIKANVPILLVIVPSADGTELTKDAIFDSNSLLLYVVCKQDNTSLTTAKELDVMETTQNILFGIEYFLHYDATTCGALLHEELQYIDFSSRHIDPERNYLGCNGWSLSLQLSDSNFLTDYDYNADALKVTITDGLAIIKKDVGEAYTCTPSAPGEAHNSDESISIEVPAGGSAEFPSGILKEFDGSETELIAGKNVTAKVPINNLVTDSAGGVLLNLAPGQPGQIADSIGTNPDGSTFPVKATQPFNVPLNLELEFVFQAGYDMTITTGELPAKYAAVWKSNDLVNVATIQWKVNDENESLPFFTNEGDKVTAVITPTDPASEASIILKTVANG